MSTLAALLRRSSLVRRLVRRLRGRPPAGRRRAGRRVSWIEKELWSGYARYARPDLDAALRERRRPAAQRAAAAWALARWHAAQGDPHQALACIAAARRLSPPDPRDLAHVLLESACLHAAGSAHHAQRLLDQAMAGRGAHPDLCLAYANTHLSAAGDGLGPEADAARLAWVNRIYRAEGLAPLALADPTSPLTIDNLTAPEAAPLPPSGLPLISVLLPARNAATTLGTALRGLLAQTWANLEVLVVDDASDDDTHQTALQTQAADARVVVLQHARDLGAAGARNTALRAARGALITTHDADDWSHAQKLELQARALLSDADAVGTLSILARATPALHFVGPYRPGPSLLYENLSSLMLRAGDLERLGGWDRVRVGSDTEFSERAAALFGRRALRALRPQVPLSFARVHADSLTRQPETHIRSIYFGLRRDYREAARAWHRTVRSPQELRLDPRSQRLPFPVPGPNRMEGQAQRPFDLIVAADLSMRAGSFHSALNLVLAALQAGLRVGLFHWRRYTPDSRERLNPAARRLAAQGAVELLSAGEQASARTFVIGFAVVLRHLLDELPAVASERQAVIVNQMASAWTSRPSSVYDPLRLRAHMRQLFGVEGVWVPISPRVRRLMMADPRYPPPHDEDWIPLLDAQLWSQKPLRWRGGERPRPVIGRHSRDHTTKWPAGRRALRAAYCVERACEVRVLGGAHRAEQILGGRPSNWTVLDFDALEVQAFLAELDFFVHYPHEDYIEEFGRSTIEAMAAGVPAVLPPDFEEIFGEAAAYARPHEVWGVVEALWRDEQAYLELARRGRAYVERHCGYDQLPGRLERLHAGSS